MKTRFVVFLLLVFSAGMAVAQTDENAIETLFSPARKHPVGGYGAITNKFTTFNGQFANIVEVYGGWYINHRFFLGFAAGGMTNDIAVPSIFSANSEENLSYGYGHAGLMTEYVLHSGKRVHLAFQLFGGGGFTTQYLRHPDNFSNDYTHHSYDEDCFFVAEPGVTLEMNVFRWMRFSPGVSYRAAFNSSGKGLSDDALSAMSYNLTLKFGKF